MKVRGIAACMAALTVVCGEGSAKPTFEEAGADSCIVAVDQSTMSAVILDGAKTNILWRWTPKDDPHVRAADVGSFLNLSECKVVDFGATLLVNASGGGVAAIDIATTNAVWYAKASRGKDGPHALARLPDGRIAVANSVGCDALEILDVRRHPFDPAKQRRVRAAEVSGAHGVCWHAQRHSLFVLGYTNLLEYAYLADRCSLIELRRWRYDGVLGDPYGHDLTPDARGGYFMTNHAGVWRFDPETGTFTSVRAVRDAKSFSRDSRKGDLLQVPNEKWWSDRLTVFAPDGQWRTVGPFAGARFYKARWFAADARALTWADEFNGAALDTNRWTRCKKGRSDWNRHMSERPDLVAVTNGSLVMYGVANADTNADPRPYLTGGVGSRDKGTMRLGKVEMRVRLEDHQKGAWPALWMCGNEKDDLGRGWPWNGEIDIVERLNGNPFVHQSVHSGWKTVKKRPFPVHSGRGRIRKGEWNVYGLEITPDTLIWSVNGAETFRYRRLADAGDPDQWPFIHDFFFYLDMQLGGKWVGEVDLSTLPVRMYIDWIRVYE